MHILCWNGGKALKRGVVLLLAGLLLSCADDLSRRHAAHLIEGHLRSVAPDVLYSMTVEIEIREMLRSAEHTREVRFNAVFRTNPATSGKRNRRSMFNRPSELSAYFQRSDKGWTLARYGEPMKELVARLWHFQIRSQYLNLLDTISTIGIEATAWESERIAKLRSKRPGAWAEYLSGISEGELNRRVMRKNLRIPVGVQWGVLSAPNTRFYSILWTQLTSDPVVVCAKRIGSRAEDKYPPIEFNWMGTKTMLKCKGGRVNFNPYTATEEGLDLIDRSGGILHAFRK